MAERIEMNISKIENSTNEFIVTFSENVTMLESSLESALANRIEFIVLGEI